MTKNLSEVENAAMGAFGGWVDVSLLQATNYWKNAAQQGLPFETNPRVLYRGYIANCLNNSSSIMMQFAATGLIQKYIAGESDRKLTEVEQIGAAFVSGYLSGFVCGPIELAMIQQQRKGGTLAGTATSLLGGGPSIVTRGTLGICLREGIYCGCFLGLMPVWRQKLQVMFPDTLGKDVDKSRLAAALTCGPACSLLSHPPDTFKSCMQGDIERSKFGTMKETCSVLVKERGLTSLWAGAPWRIFRQICAVFILDKIAADLSPIVFPHRFK
eukprot:CAMPEP_0117523102 /NCGR_PEP_ID=MMETSP0784-20121206/34552_1 /TAXON_ID=39447 /ORGANISM="" /LENGTH=270 /DNA_ID=CAMNT_0005319199 /DNA_START=16 /DNA_END=828 /DNA_ORIENTATION=-